MKTLMRQKKTDIEIQRGRLCEYRGRDGHCLTCRCNTATFSEPPEGINSLIPVFGLLAPRTLRKISVVISHHV